MFLNISHPRDLASTWLEKTKLFTNPIFRFSKMHTVTNTYILHLAVADECFLFGIPFLIATMSLKQWPFGMTMCKIYFTTTSINQITSSLFLMVRSEFFFTIWNNVKCSGAVCGSLRGGLPPDIISTLPDGRHRQDSQLVRVAHIRSVADIMRVVLLPPQGWHDVNSSTQQNVTQQFWKDF